MDKFVIQGDCQLQGEVFVSGAKNAALPLLATALLTDHPTTLHRVPDLADIRALLDLLGDLGCDISRDGETVTLRVTDESNSHAEYERVRKMRASICVLGPLVAKRGYARVSMPGGCAIGARPIDLHLKGLKALGAKIHLEGGDIVVTADRLKGTSLFLGGPFGSTVLGTANVMMAAVLAEGTTIIESAACEPEIADLAHALNTAGAKIRGIGSPRLTIEGVEELGRIERTVIPDRIEAGTFMMAAAATRGDVIVRDMSMDHLMAVTEKMREAGIAVDPVGESAVHIAVPGDLKPVDVTTQPYPGFPTDLQAQLMTVLALADGNSAVTERIYPDRFMHVSELLRMGANIRKDGAIAIVTGQPELFGAPVMASDLRASAALVIAALVAHGESEILRVYHIDRGYQRIEEKLGALGANIQRVAE